MSAPTLQPEASYRFGQTQLLPLQRLVLVDGRPVDVGARAFDVLLALIERRDRLVRRDELLDLVWRDVAVEPNNLAVQISALRKKLGANVIATIPGRGYRFCAAVQGKTTPVAALSGPAAPDARQRTNLPEVLSPLIGREDVRRILTARIDAHRVVSIVGAGGIGKSCLAQQLLHERRDDYRHGVCWVELASARDAASLPLTIATALGIGLPAAGTGEMLQAALAPLEILICLDSAEHLAVETAALVQSLLTASTRVGFLVTSQVPLHLPDESVVRLGGLSVPSPLATADEAAAFGAVDLFTRRAQAADVRFVFDDRNAAAVIRICAQLEGLPLAIELAAARAVVLGVDRILASLDERLQILTGGFRSLPARQRTLRAAMEWSHQLLAPDERVVFRRLAVVAGSASLELVQAIVDDSDSAGGAASVDRWAAVDALAGLVDKSLVVALVDDADRNEPRYRLLDTPRAYAAELLAAAGETAMLEKRHAKAMAARLARFWTVYHSGRIGFRDWQGEVQREGENAWIAVAWALRRQAFDLVLAMAPVMLTPSLRISTSDEQTRVAESVEQWLTSQAAKPEQLETRIQLMHFWRTRQLPRSLTAAHAALSLAEACNDRFAAYRIHGCLALVHSERKELQAAANALEHVDALEDASWPAARLRLGADARSAYHFVKGPPQDAIEPVRRCMRLAQLAGFDGMATQSNLIAIGLATGDYASSATNARALLGELGDSRNQRALALVRNNLLGALVGLSRIDEAEIIGRAAWETARHFNLHGDCADYLALLCALRGRFVGAALLVGYANAVHARRGAERWPSEMRAHERCLALLAAAPNEVEVERARREGARVLDAEVAQLAFGDVGGSHKA